MYLCRNIWYKYLQGGMTMARNTVEIKEGTYDEFYSEAERNGAGGLLLVVTVWICLFNPLLLLMNVNYPLRLLQQFTPELGYAWGGWFGYCNQIVKYVLCISSIVVGYRLNKLGKGSLLQTKIFLLVQTIWLLGLSFLAVMVVMDAFDAGLLIVAKVSLSYVLDQLMFRLSSSLVFFGIVYGYLSISKRVQEIFYLDTLKS